MYYNIKTGKYDPCCDNLDVEFSKTTCTCCWHCNNCGRRGCANLVGYMNEKINITKKDQKKD